MTSERGDNPDNRQLLIKLINNDPRAFHSFYDLFSPRVYGNILRMVKDSEIAQELLQNVFVKIWEKRNLLDPEKPFASYLFQIANNQVYDHFRKIALDKKLDADIASLTNESYCHVEEEIIYKESNEIFLHAVEKLSPQRKQVFILCRIEGKSYNEVSSLLNISSSTISDHLLKSNRFIKAQLLISDPLSMLFILSMLYF